MEDGKDLIRGEMICKVCRFRFYIFDCIESIKSNNFNLTSPYRTKWYPFWLRQIFIAHALLPY